jgi:hypothetical protein
MVIHYIEYIFLQELMEKLKMPSDADLMKIAIADLKNSSISLEDRQRALQELLVLALRINQNIFLYPQKTETSKLSPSESRLLT